MRRDQPLEELGVKNFDFLLWNLDGSVILGEAKSSIPDNAKRIVNQITERKRIAEKHKKYIEIEYLGKDINHMEFVLSTYVQHGEKISKAIVESGIEFITWVVEPYTDTLSTYGARPSTVPEDLESKNADELLKILDRRHSHDIAALNSDLDRITTSFGHADVLPTTAIVDRLRVVIQARRVVERYPCVDRSDIKEYVSNSALNYTEKRVADISSDLIEAGKRINFLSDWEDDRADFKLISNYTSKDDLEEVLEKKWLDWKIEGLKDDLRDECEERITAEIGKQSRLSLFLSDA